MKGQLTIEKIKRAKAILDNYIEENTRDSLTDEYVLEFRVDMMMEIVFLERHGIFAERRMKEMLPYRFPYWEAES